jgi:hypothetical protein
VPVPESVGGASGEIGELTAGGGAEHPVHLGLMNTVFAGKCWRVRGNCTTCLGKTGKTGKETQPCRSSGSVLGGKADRASICRVGITQGLSVRT